VCILQVQLQVPWIHVYVLQDLQPKHTKNSCSNTKILLIDENPINLNRGHFIHIYMYVIFVD
jgi:hypothetical protein